MLFALARALLEACAGTRRRGGDVVAAIVALAAGLSPPWQCEAAAPSGSTLGAMLALLPLWLVTTEGVSAGVVGLALGVGVSYEPMVGVAGIASALAMRAMAPVPAWGKTDAGKGAAAFVVGLAPFALGLARRGAALGLASGVFATPFGERGESAPGMPLGLLREDVGAVSSLAAAAGLVLAVLLLRARPLALGLAAIAGAGLLAMELGAPAGPTRYGAPVLAAVGAAYALAGAALDAAVRAVAAARIPFARASAAMILVLEAALPARAADDSSARADERNPAASEMWNDVACGPLPAGAALLVRDPRVETRLYAARAAGELRPDLALVPVFDLAGHGAMLELVLDAKLLPLWHDAALVGADQESSLSAIAQERPLVAPFDPAWERALARHLVPVGLFARFEPEPRGGSDRRVALDHFSGLTAPQERDRLAKAIDGDPELLGITVALLRARAIALAAASERDVVSRAIDDLRPFSPRDPVAEELGKRMAATRGVIDLKGIAP
jgi:hypothetical protein